MGLLGAQELLRSESNPKVRIGMHRAQGDALFGFISRPVMERWPFFCRSPLREVTSGLWRLRLSFSSY